MPRTITGEIKIIEGESPSTYNGRLTLSQYDIGYASENNATTLEISIPKKLYGYNILYEAMLYPTSERYRSNAQVVSRDTPSETTVLSFDIPYYVVRNPGKVGLTFLGLNGLIVVLKTLEIETYVGTSVNDDEFPDDVITQLINDKADNLNYSDGHIQLVANGELIGQLVDIHPVFYSYDEIVSYSNSSDSRIGELVSYNDGGNYVVYQILGKGNVTKLTYQVVLSYNDLLDRPTLGGIVLEGDMTPEDLGLATKDDIQDLNDKISSIEEPIVSYESIDDFPRPGIANKLYLDITNDILYTWDEGISDYKIVSNNYNNITIISGGNANAW